MSIRSINSLYSKILLTKIRDKHSEVEEIKSSIFELGKIVSQEIIEKFSNQHFVETPMGEKFNGLRVLEPPSVVISTKDDYEMFSAGISSMLKNTIRGYMDFTGLRGQSALTAPIRNMMLPELKYNHHIDTLIIAKSVLGTGCTAISLTNRAIEKYKPKNIIVAAVFHSSVGVQEILHEFPHSELLVFGEPDELNDDGMLIPGVGNLDKRLQGLQ